MEIRKVQDGDLNLIIELYTESLKEYPSAFLACTDYEIYPDDDWRDRVKRYSEGKNEVAFKLNVGPEYCGLLIGSNDYISHIWVSRKHQRKGYGTKLLHEYLEWASARNTKEIRLHVNKNSEEAIKFYKSQGFKSNEEYDETTEAELLMEMILNQG